MARLPQPGRDAGVWGDILNDFLKTEHTASGTLKIRTDGTLNQFYKLPAGGIPANDLATDINAKLASAASAYQKPASGIPQSDLTTSLQALLNDIPLGTTINVRTFGAMGDGATDDTIAVTAAFQAANAANHSTVFFPKGTYIISSELSVPSNCTVRGEGYHSVLQRKTGNYLINILKISGKENVRITNVRIDSLKDDIIANYNSEALDGNHMYVTCNGIYITGENGEPSRDITIDHCWLHDAFYGNIEADDVDGMNIEANFLYHGRDNQINARVNGLGGYCRNITVSGNIVRGKGPINSPNQFSGIQFLRGAYITITGNVCYGFGNQTTNEGNGIGLEGCRYATISSNICHHNLNQGIKIDKTEEGQPSPWDTVESYVPGERVAYNGQYYLAKTYNTNKIPPSSAADWEITTSMPFEQYSVHVTVSGNNVCNNNYFAFTNGQVQTNGIFAQYCEDILIKGNVVSGNCHGIVNGSHVRGLTVQDNSIYGNELMGIAFWNNLNAYGPFVIQKNYIGRNGGKGIDTVIPVFIRGNTVEHNGQAGISVAITGNVIQNDPIIEVADNILIDNGDSGILVNGGFSTPVPIEVRNNFAPASTIQPRGFGENGTPVRCVNNRFLKGTIEKWYINHADSVWIDEKTDQIKKVTSDYTVVDDDQTIIVSPNSDTTVTLQAPSIDHPPAHPGRKVTITKSGVSAFAVNVTSQGGTIHGTTTVGNNESYTYISDGSSWCLAS